MSNCTLLCTQNAAFDQILESYKKFSCILTDFCLISSSLTNIDLLTDPVFFFRASGKVFPFSGAPTQILSRLAKILKNTRIFDKLQLVTENVFEMKI